MLGDSYHSYGNNEVRGARPLKSMESRTRQWPKFGNATIARRPTRSISRSTDRKSTRLNSSHLGISYAVFCLKKKKATDTPHGHAEHTTTNTGLRHQRSLA